ncbi:hypothetical protein CYOC110262_10275 [Cytobacillus oceanisediminis]|uniref:Uncharacterized protein n=2 Tax=Cytobacillus oceanisediminis TaxID=665099 RepID=A0A562K389_9BACI|nr:hypothetical protein IQ19_00960 [Cytobacillus oceanisediminis]
MLKVLIMSEYKICSPSVSEEFARLLAEVLEKGHSVDATLGDLLGEITDRLEAIVIKK